MKIGINAGQKFWEVYNETARARLEQLGASFAEVPRERAVTEGDVVELVRDADVVVGTWGMLPFTRRVLDACPSVGLVVYAAGSVKGFVTEELRDRGVTVLSAAHINGRPVAEFVLGIMITELKGVFRANARIHDAGRLAWRRSEIESPGLYGSTVGLIGLGKITRYLIGLLRPFDVRIMVEDPYLEESQAKELGVEKASIEQIMQEADVVSLHHANIPQNWGMITRERLALMKPGSAFVNTSRGRLVDEAALVDALRTQDLVAYLDVTYPEPPEDGHPFYSLPNCILTPNVAGSYAREVERMGEWAVDQVEAWSNGKPLDGVVDLGRLDSIA